jgi:DNA-binding CsgD family transcriptional regulator/PAS domain-containing protein
MAVDEGALAVIQAFYDASMDESRWPAALEVLVDLTGSQAATFWVLDPSPEPRLPTFTFLNFDPGGMQVYRNQMVPLDPTNRYLVAHPDETIVHDGLVITEREKDRDVYYDWHCRLSDTRYRLVGQAHPTPSAQAGVALHRTRKAGRFEPSDIEQFRFLHRHLAQALTIGFRLGTLGTMQKSTAEVLDRNPAAIVLLDEHKRIVFANRAAQSLQASGDGVLLSPRGVVLARKQDNDLLRGMIELALAANTVPAEGVLRVPRLSGKRPYAILVSPISRNYSLLSDVRPAVCVVITDPELPTPLLKQRLMSAFSLTEAEARLGALLAEGENLHRAADRLRITYGTCRSRLAAIFQKTETRSQAELVALLLKMLAA